jgi:hypothetical protein
MTDAEAEDRKAKLPIDPAEFLEGILDRGGHKCDPRNEGKYIDSPTLDSIEERELVADEEIFIQRLCEHQYRTEKAAYIRMQAEQGGAIPYLFDDIFTVSLSTISEPASFLSRSFGLIIEDIAHVLIDALLPSLEARNISQLLLSAVASVNKLCSYKVYNNDLLLQNMICCKRVEAERREDSSQYGRSFPVVSADLKASTRPLRGEATEYSFENDVVDTYTQWRNYPPGPSYADSTPTTDDSSCVEDVPSIVIIDLEQCIHTSDPFMLQFNVKNLLGAFEQALESSDGQVGRYRHIWTYFDARYNETVSNQFLRDLFFDILWSSLRATASLKDFIRRSEISQRARRIYEEERKANSDRSNQEWWRVVIRRFARELYNDDPSRAESLFAQVLDCCEKMRKGEVCYLFDIGDRDRNSLYETSETLSDDSCKRDPDQTLTDSEFYHSKYETFLRSALVQSIFLESEDAWKSLPGPRPVYFPKASV